MSLSIDQIAEAFCSWKFATTFPYMDDEIRWHIIDRAELAGREAVIDQCGKAKKFLETVTADAPKLKISRAENLVIVEGTAQFQNQQNQISSVASCDLFRFSDGRLVEITSYVIDLEKT